MDCNVAIDPFACVSKRLRASPQRKRVASGILTWEGAMKSTIRLLSISLMVADSLALCVSTGAQQAMPSDKQLLQTYNANREISLVGTVVKYESASMTPPIGAHVTLQTVSGQVDVHLGNARILKSAHLELNAGDNVRIVGEPMALGDGTFFAARIVQKGLQAVAVRNAKGFPLAPASTLTPAQKEALRGVR
jgi:hypothetical protein